MNNKNKLPKAVTWVLDRPITITLSLIVFTLSIINYIVPLNIVNNPEYSWGYSAIMQDPSWKGILSSLFITQDIARAILFSVIMIGAIGYLEAKMKFVKFTVSAFGISLAAIAITLSIQLIGSGFNELWIQNTLYQTVQDPFLIIFGMIMVGTAYLPTLWRRRVRFMTISLILVYVLYGGDIVYVARGIASLIGLAVGALLNREHLSWHIRVASRRETRILLTLLIIATAIGPIIAVNSNAGIGVLSASVMGIYISPLWSIIAPVLLIIIAFGVQKGYRVWLWAAIIIEATITLITVITYVGVISFTDINDVAKSLNTYPIELYAWFAAGALLPLFVAILLFVNRRSFYTHNQILPSTTDLELINNLLRKYDCGSQSFMTTWNGNSYWFNKSKTAAIAYRVIDSVALTTCDPICSDKNLKSTVGNFVSYCQSQGLTPVFYSVHKKTLRALSDKAWSSIPVASEAVIDIKSFSFEGSKKQNIRTAVSRAARENITALLTTYEKTSLSIRSQINELSEQWIAEKGFPELGFTLGGVDELHDSNIRLALAVDENGVLQCVLSFMPAYKNGQIIGWTLDFMRRRPESMNGIVDFLIAEFIDQLHSEDVDYLSLSGVPLTIEISNENNQPAKRLGSVLSFLGSILDSAYGFRSLAAFKRKYQPDYTSLYMCYNDQLVLRKIGTVLAKAYLPGLSMKHITKLILHRRKK